MSVSDEGIWIEVVSQERIEKDKQAW